MTNDNLTDAAAQLVDEARRLGLHEERKEVLRAIQYYHYLGYAGADAGEVLAQELKVHLAMAGLLRRVNAFFRSPGETSPLRDTSG